MTECKLSRYFFHCSDGVDLVLDRKGGEIEASDVLWSGMRAAERLIRALPSYDGWSAWTVSVHNERGFARGDRSCLAVGRRHIGSTRGPPQARIHFEVP